MEYVNRTYSINLLDYYEIGNPAITTIGLGIASAEANTEPEGIVRIAQCFFTGFGIVAAVDLFRNMIDTGVTTSGILKVVKTIARRSLGFVAVALGVHGFGCCMDYWSWGCGD